MLWANAWSSAVCDGNWDKPMNQMKWWPKLAYSISTCTTSVALLVHLLHPPTSFRSLSLLDMLLLSLMSLSTPVNILEAARSCRMCEMELQSDALSDTHTELKMIVTLVLRSHTSPTAIFLGSTTLGQIREMDWTQRKGRSRETQRLKILKPQLEDEEEAMSCCFQHKHWFTWNSQISWSLTLNWSSSFKIHHSATLISPTYRKQRWD